MSDKRLPIPTTMHAVQLDKPGDQLVLREIPVPRPQAGQVLVRMAAAPINPSDLSSLTGLEYNSERRYPFTPGLEGSGTVVAAGPGFMSRLLLGSRVACSVSLDANGTWAEYLLTEAGLCMPLFYPVSLEEAALLIVNPLTALALIDIARQGRHRAIVSTAAASALGGMLTRLGRRYRIPILHVVRRPEQVTIVRQRGGDLVLDSSQPGFPDQLRENIIQLQATLLLDAIGGEMTQALVEAAPYGSTILCYACLSDQKCAIDTHFLLLKHIHLEGWFLSNWARERNLWQLLPIFQRAQSLLRSDLHTPIRQRYPLAAAQQAVDAYTRHMSGGKVLLVADPREIPVDV